VLLVLLVSLWGPRHGAGQEPPPELVKVREEIRALEERLRTLDAQRSDLGAQRRQLETKLALAVARVQEAEAANRASESAVGDATLAAEEARHEVERAVRRLRLQVSLLVVLGRAGWAPLILHAVGSGKDVPQRITMALTLVREDQRRRLETEQLLERRTAALGLLSRRREELAGTTRELAERRRELEATRQRIVAELGSLEQEQRKGAVALASAQEAESRLERLWGTLTDTDTTSESDIKLLRGGLPWPLRGEPEVLQRFGQRRDPVYGTVTVSNGVEIAGQPGDNVVAVAGGSVAYAQFFKGYGNLVILDHGSQVYSLYGQLASVLVRSSQRVGIGEPVGVVGRDDAGTGKVYLEIRSGKSAQDPLTWLRPLGEK
jgi:septal ring factor EnvC (AmiA/AmiB activator)